MAETPNRRRLDLSVTEVPKRTERRSRLDLSITPVDRVVGSAALGQTSRRPRLKLTVEPTGRSAIGREPTARPNYLSVDQLDSLITQGWAPGKLACRLACQLNLMLLSNPGFTPSMATTVRDTLMHDPAYSDYWGASSTLGTSVWNTAGSTTADLTERVLGIPSGTLKIAAIPPGGKDGPKSNVAQLLSSGYAVMAETATHARVLFDIGPNPRQSTCIFDPMSNEAVMRDQAQALDFYFHDANQVTYA